MLNLKNTLDGYLKNVEVIGNTIQNTNNLADIRSVGDKLEGQELYNIDVVSCGKNLFKMCKDNEIHRNSYNGIIEIQHNGFSLTDTRNGDMAGFVMKCKPNTKYVVTFNDVSSNKVQKFFRAYTEYPVDSNANYNINVGTTNGSSIKLTTTSNCNYIFFGMYGSNGTSTIKDIQVEEGTVATSYEPYQENKLEILSPVQLEKVGDVADRIICKNGVWGIEKNIQHTWDNLSSIIDFGQFDSDDTTGKYNVFRIRTNESLGARGIYPFKDMSSESYDEFRGYDGECVWTARAYTYFKLLKGKTDLATFKLGKSFKFLIKSDITQFIPLPHDQQVKLRTFAGQTNIFFNTEIAGQVKAQVPKSLGAVVNTHTEQIEMLHNALKSVLAGDMYSLATILYPEDFIQDNSEQDIMVIPE